MKSSVVSTAAVAAGLAVIGLVVWLCGAQLFHMGWTLVRVALPILVILVIGSGICLYFWDEGLAYIAGTVGIALAVISLAAMAYMPAHKMSETVKVEDASVSDYRQRAPYDVATATSERNLGGRTGDATGSVKALPALGDNGLYTTSIVRRGVFQGYEATQTVDVPLYGSTSAKNVEFCDFSESAKLRFGGIAPSNNLDRAIMWKTSGTTSANRDDAFVVCEDGTPMVYAPLTKLSGDILFPHRVPAGVAVYNGKTGELVINDEMESDTLLIYPKSLAIKQRESTQASGSFWDWMFKRAGFEDTSVDAEDPNGENRAEFGLVAADGSVQHYVTPLTARGSDASISAMGTVNAGGSVKAGELHDYTVQTFAPGESRQANSTIASRITGEILSFKSTGLTVFEVVPSEEGTWTATIGKDQSVLYRAIIHPDGAIELLDASGKTVAGAQPEGETAPEEALTADKPLDQMTAEELEQLGQDILRELASRTAQ